MRLSAAAALRLLALLSLAWLAAGQSYVPQVAIQTRCSDGLQLVQVGNLDSSNSTLFPNNQQGSLLGTWWNPYYQYVYTTPFNNTAFGAVLTQLAVSLLDNSALLSPAYIRLALYLFQEAETRSIDFNEAVLLGETDEITLYPSKDQIVYANLMTPVTLLSEGEYGIGIYSSAQIYIAGGPRSTGFSAIDPFASEVWGYNDYSSPQSLFMYPGDRSHPVAAIGCLDPNGFRNKPNVTYYAFCSLVETYLRQPPHGGGSLGPYSPRYQSARTNVTRYTGVIAINSTAPQKTAYGTGYSITFMEGDVQTTTNAGAFFYPPLKLRTTPFFFRSSHPDFKQADDLLYPNVSIPLSTDGIVISTTQNRTRLYATNVSIDSTIGTEGQTGIVTQVYFSSFDIFPQDDLDTVITACNVPVNFDYQPDFLPCPAGSAYVNLGDVNAMDLDPLEEDEYYDYLPPNFISFRFFTVYTPDTTAYQLSYFSYSNPSAIVHLRLGLFRTNTSYVDSTSALPQYELLQMTAEVELVNVADTVIVANLSQPVQLTQGSTYAIGVWADAEIYGPQARWGVDAAGLTIAYNTIDQYGTFPGVVYALGGQSGTQPMSVNACAARQTLSSWNLCAAFGEYVLTPAGWFLVKRFYSGTVWGLSAPNKNTYGIYNILTAGNGTYIETWQPVNPPFATRSDYHGPLRPAPQKFYLNGTWNLNNFQVQSPDWLYVSSQTGLVLDGSGLQVIVNLDQGQYNEVFAVILNAVRPRGSPTWFYQEAVEFDYYDYYQPLGNSAATFTLYSDAAPAICDIDYVPWNWVIPPNRPLDVSCDGLGYIESTYGDNRVVDYVNDKEGNTIAAQTVYTVNFTGYAGTLLDQVAFDILNNTAIMSPIMVYIGIYASNGSLLTQGLYPTELFEVLDQMVVIDLQPVTLTADGQYFIGLISDTALAMATSTVLTPAMAYSGSGLPDTFKMTTMKPTVPITAYGCVQASHYICGSFQYYQGDNYSPVAIDYLYQGLLLVDKQAHANDKGMWAPVIYGVGHLSVTVRIAMFPNNFHVGFTDMLLSAPGNASLNYIYVSGNGGQSLDENGLTFLTDDDFGYPFSIIFNYSTNLYDDTTNAQLGVELLQLWELGVIDRSTTPVPQCSFLDLPTLVQPPTTLSNNTGVTCDAGSSSLMWGDDLTADYFYFNEGQFAAPFSVITLSPINTGPVTSVISQLGLALNQNGNVFAHIRMALYDANNTFLSGSNEVTIDNPRDVTLYFTLDKPQLLQPASVYWVAYWADVTLYMAGADSYNAHCYYGLKYGYDLQPWPATVGSVEAEYYDCVPLPVAALGCSHVPEPPPPPPGCPPAEETKETGMATTTVAAVVAATALLSVLLTVLAMRLYQGGKCKGLGLGRGGAGDDGISRSSLSDDSTSSGGGKYSHMSD